MKVGSKPISSPSRTEKFPPPLLRFLRSNVGSKSRGRSRSSPMFVRKKNASAIETQEPSSPKVTCIGQVRVRRSSKNYSRSNSGSSRPTPVKCPSFWVPRNLFCNPRKLKLGPFRAVWRKWVSFFGFGHSEKDEMRDDSSKIESNRGSQLYGSETEQNDGNADGGEEARVEEEKEETEVFTTSTPPKNAFLLTRCRSAPYRSSSLASRFWSSPQANCETEEDGNEEKERWSFGGEKQTEKTVTSESVPGSRNSVEVLGTGTKFGGLINGRNSEGSAEEMKRNTALPPLLLTRCKSEPAKTGKRLLFDLQNHQFLEPNKVGL